MKPVLRLVDVAIGSKPTPYSRYFELCKGLAEFRSGNFEAAIEWLSRGQHEFSAVISERNRVERDSLNNDECEVTASYYLAMAHYRAGHRESAQNMLIHARQQLDSEVPELSTMHPKSRYQRDWLIAQVAAREAESRLGRTQAATPPAGSYYADALVISESLATAYRWLGLLPEAEATMVDQLKINPNDLCPRMSAMSALVVYQFLRDVKTKSVRSLCGPCVALLRARFGPRVMYFGSVVFDSA